MDLGTRLAGGGSGGDGVVHPQQGQREGTGEEAGTGRDGLGKVAGMGLGGTWEGHGTKAETLKLSSLYSKSPRPELVAYIHTEAFLSVKAAIFTG